MKTTISFSQRITKQFGSDIAFSIQEDVDKKMEGKLNEDETLYVLPNNMLTSMGLKTDDYVYIGCVKKQVSVNKEGMKQVGEFLGNPVYAIALKVSDYAKKQESTPELAKSKDEEAPKPKAK